MVDSLRRTKKRAAVQMAASFGVSKSRIGDVDAGRIRKVFETLVVDTGAKCVILIDTGGALLAKIGDPGTLAIHQIAGLLAGQLAVARTVARVFDGEFTIMLHQGKRDNIHLNMVGKKRLLAVIFRESASLGTVIMCSRRAAAMLETALTRALKPVTVKRPAVKADGIGRDFVDAAKSRLDELLQ